MAFTVMKGTHPTVLAYNACGAEYEVMQGKLEELKKKVEEAKKNLAPMNKGEYRITKVIRGGNLYPNDVYRFHLTRVDDDLIGEAKQVIELLFGKEDRSSYSDENPKERVSVGYRWVADDVHDSSMPTQGRIWVTGCGTYVIKEDTTSYGARTGIPCSEEEWWSIQEGKIPSRLCHDWLIQ